MLRKMNEGLRRDLWAKLQGGNSRNRLRVEYRISLYANLNYTMNLSISRIQY